MTGEIYNVVTNAPVSPLVATNAVLAAAQVAAGNPHHGGLSDVLLVCQIAVAVLTICVIVTKLIDWLEKRDRRKRIRPQPGEVIDE